ncbi:formate--tetrahydrofolate ligase [Enterococcus timonensis]|uniref:formate--tetrahydrofolate ligase n=1 Tax=Enterococcus timonensis TaxID=1852364 RepID=UPI0008D9DA6E|nr:formate--tetrahydrofolate ligase [Enterococcus timonensis]
MDDLTIAQQARLEPIEEIGAKLHFSPAEIEPFGHFKGKISYEAMNAREENNFGQLVLVTSMTPTAAGEGKSTVTVGLADAFALLNKKVAIALREPSAGPVFGRKGGATGGGLAQVVPMEEINLHFTGDMHALTQANNLLSALLDNHLQQGNALNIDSRKIYWNRVLDINDRTLRNITIGLGGPLNGWPREDHFQITVASELMAVLCLAKNIADLKNRIASIVVAENTSGKIITVADLQATDALTILLKEALKPNLVQTLAGTPAFVHGGPFANIAHGCNSVMATRLALQTADITVTEAGFGSDLGAEKFLDIKAPVLGKYPDAVVMVATIRALKMHGGLPLNDLDTENLAALEAGFSNLAKHLENIAAFHLPQVVALNRFTSDTDAEIALVKKLCAEKNISCILTDVWAKGGKGAVELAEKLQDILAQQKEPVVKLYESTATLEKKITTIAEKIYGAQRVTFTKKVQKQLRQFAENGWGRLPICMAKTPNSLSDNPTRLGRPENFTIEIRELQAKIGAGFIVALAGSILTMPGLPKEPNALKMTIDDDGTVHGLS